MLCGGVYREWSSECPEDDAIEIINQFQTATKENKPTVVMGDMNLDTKKWRNNNYDHKEIADKWRNVRL